MFSPCSNLQLTVRQGSLTLREIHHNQLLYPASSWFSHNFQLSHSMLVLPYFILAFLYPYNGKECFFPLFLFMFLVLGGDLFNNGQGLVFFIKALKYINHFTFVSGRGDGKARKLCIKIIKLGLLELITGIIKLSAHLKEKLDQLYAITTCSYFSNSLKIEVGFLAHNLNRGVKGTFYFYSRRNNSDCHVLVFP